MFIRRIFYSKYRLNNFSTKLNENPNSYSNLDSKLASIAQSIKVTDSCYIKIEEILKINPEKKFLRLMVEGGGCSGYQYIFKMDNTINAKEDITIGNESSKVVIDKLSLPFLEGSVIDYKESLIRSAFTVIDNPKADISCSCGSSFAPKMGNNKI